MTLKAIIVFLFLALLGTGAVWQMIRSLKRSDDPPKLLFKYVLTFVVVGLFCYAVLFRTWWHTQAGAFIVPVICVVVGIAMSIVWAPNLGALLAKPITSLFDGGDTEPDPQPLYSMAQAKRKAGKFREALYEIQRQLERFPNDATGQMMLAEILAENMNDLAGAQNTVERFLRQPGHPAPQVAYALNTLADWQLKYGQDIEAARRSLERILALFPDTQEALLASQRIAHLGSTDSLLAAREPAKVQLKPGAQNIGLMKDSSVLRPAEDDPAAKAAAYVKHLGEYPNDSEIREKLALIYAEHYQRLDLATGELNQLIKQPNQPAKQVARWLHLLCDLQVKHAGDEALARETLQRIIDKFPNLAAAEQARLRLDHLRLEIHGRKENEAIQLGVYEQNIGLKLGKPKG